MPTDGVLDEIEYRSEIVGGQAHPQVGDESFEYKLEVRGKYRDADVVSEFSGIALPQQALLRGGGQSLGTLGPTAPELHVGAEAPGHFQPGSEPVRPVLWCLGDQIAHDLDKSLLGDDVGHPYRIVLGQREKQ